MTDQHNVSMSTHDLAALPPRYETSQTWYGSDMQCRSEEWTHNWTDTELVEIGDAVASVLSQDLDLIDMVVTDFPLPNVSRRLHEIKNEVLHGRGFKLLRGLPVLDWTIREAAIAYWGMGLYMGEPCSQNGKGHLLGHVKNLGYCYDDPKVRGYQTKELLPFHTDASDIVGLLCWRSGKSGGLSSIASSTTVYNEMLARRPDLAATMLEPFCMTRWGEVPAGMKSWTEMPVFMPSDDRMITHYVRSAIRKGEALPGAPGTTKMQREALDLFDEITREPGVPFNMAFQPGDIQLLSNHNVLHSRTAYEDWREPERQRHLLRLWLSCDDGPRLPEVFTRNWGGLTDSGRPNGIAVSGVTPDVLLEAE